MKLSEILTGPETWGQGPDICRKTPRLCVGLALIKIQAAESWSPARTRRETNRLVKVIGRRDFVDWNDAPGRTWDEVSSVVDAYDRDRMLNP